MTRHIPATSRPERRIGARLLVPLLAAAVAVAFTVWRPADGSGTEAPLAPEKEARLPSQGDNVVAVAVDLSARGGDGLDLANLSVIARVDAFIRALEGVRGYSSPLRSTVVSATADDISARPFVPPDLVDSYDPATAQDLRLAYPLFPEIHPYWSADFQTVAFYLELGSRLPPATLVARLEELQRSLEPEGVAVHFTGLRPITVLVARLMTRDVRALLPFAGVLIAAVFLLTFGSARGVLLALAATATAACIGYAVFLLLPAAAGPLLVLLPVFAGGLLSDYVIHTGYHLGAHGDGSPRAARGYLALPLALTAATTAIGFLSLVGLGSGAHMFVGVTVSAGALAALALALWWVPTFGPLRGLRPRVDDPAHPPRAGGGGAGAGAPPGRRGAHPGRGGGAGGPEPASAAGRAVPAAPAPGGIDDRAGGDPVQRQVRGHRAVRDRAGRGTAKRVRAPRAAGAAGELPRDTRKNG